MRPTSATFRTDKRAPATALGLALLASLPALLSAPAAALPPGFKQKDLITGLDAVSSAILPDGRVLAVEKYGRVHLIKDGVRVQKPFFDWEANTNSRFEKGMMALIADPDFLKNGYIYVQYTNRRVGANGQDQVSRFTVEGDTVSRTSEKLMISLGDSGPNYHHGGGLAIVDGKLLIASGNRGGIGDAAPGPGNSGDKNRVQGKILRINLPEGDIPTDNPFYAENSGDGRAVYYWGLRNPFTMSYNPKTRKLWFSEVRSNAADDRVNEGGAPGTDYGFSGRSAPQPLWTASGAGAGGRCMIGSLWYTGTNFPSEWNDLYYFGGISVNQLRAMNASRSGGFKVFGDFTCPIDVKMDPAGAMYVTTRCQTEDTRYGAGKVTKVWYGDAEPTATRYSAERLSAFEAERRMDWAALPGGRLRVTVEQDGAQAVELRRMDGTLADRVPLAARGQEAVLASGSRGAHLLVWQGASSRAVAKVVLP